VAIVVACVAAGTFVGAGGRPRAFGSFVAGVLLAVPALYASLILFLATGCLNDHGHVDGWMWAAGVALLAAGVAWSIRVARRAWWAIPVSTIVGLGVTAALSVAVHGSTGWCPD
jgi:hypothetical protein